MILYSYAFRLVPGLNWWKDRYAFAAVSWTRSSASLGLRVIHSAAGYSCADSVGAHIVLGAGDQHILDAVEGHLPGSLGPITTIAGSREPGGLDDRLASGAALDKITAAAVSAVGDLIASRAEGPSPAAVRGIKAVAGQLAEQQVAVLLVSADVSADADAGSSYRTGGRPTEFLVGNSDTGAEVPLEDGLVWAAIHQDAIVVQLPDRTGPLAGEPAAALLRRGSAS